MMKLSSLVTSLTSAKIDQKVQNPRSSEDFAFESSYMTPVKSRYILCDSETKFSGNESYLIAEKFSRNFKIQEAQIILSLNLPI